MQRLILKNYVCGVSNSLILTRCLLHPFLAVPMVAPGNVQVHVINSTLAKVHWDPVPLKTVRGHLQGYKVSTVKSILFLVY